MTSHVILKKFQNQTFDLDLKSIKISEIPVRVSRNTFNDIDEIDTRGVDDDATT